MWGDGPIVRLQRFYFEHMSKKRKINFKEHKKIREVKQMMMTYMFKALEQE